ncbi:uncharacterized protein LOC131182498 isoform X2 [Hevea brasiliensis]|uniref:uncharacterized protein LOC131182498 isoform X2 n=1 Tax=Hevea brasiliensis TaxID=3981 RepID=UPI0025F5FE45|nr:uncharacterized protein LOC131182498 isoform X2 [Hevea brasiliensis]
MNSIEVEGGNNMEVPTKEMEDVVVELTSDVGAKKTTANRKRKLKSPVWAFFEMLPIGDDKKRRCKCKKCGVVYLAESKYGTGNLKRHMDTCVRRDTRDIGVYTTYVTLMKEVNSNDQYMKKVASQMFTKFEKYWSTFCDILAIAVTLDPRYKFHFVEWCYERVYSEKGISEAMHVKEKLFLLFNSYVNASACPTSLERNCQQSQGSQNVLHAPEGSFSLESLDDLMLHEKVLLVSVERCLINIEVLLDLI